LLDDFLVVAAQPLTTDRETTEALALLDAGHLQQRQRGTASAEEHESGLHLTRATGAGVLDVDLPAAGGTVETGDLLVVGNLDPATARQVTEQLAGHRTEVDVGAVHGARRGDRLARITARHHQRHPLGEGRAILAVLHVGEGVMRLQRVEAALEIVDVLAAAHEAQVRNRIDEIARGAEAFAVGQVGPELLRDFELGVDQHGLLDVDRAVFAVRGVVQLAKARVAGTGVVPRVGAFDGSGFLQLDDFQLDIGIEFLEQYRQGRTHDAGSHQHHIHCFAIVLRHQRVLQNHSIKLS